MMFVMFSFACQIWCFAMLCIDSQVERERGRKQICYVLLRKLRTVLRQLKFILVRSVFGIEQQKKTYCYSLSNNHGSGLTALFGD